MGTKKTNISARSAGLNRTRSPEKGGRGGLYLRGAEGKNCCQVYREGGGGGGVGGGGGGGGRRKGAHSKKRPDIWRLEVKNEEKYRSPSIKVEVVDRFLMLIGSQFKIGGLNLIERNKDA